VLCTRQDTSLWLETVFTERISHPNCVNCSSLSCTLWAWNKALITGIASLGGSLVDFESSMGLDWLGCRKDVNCKSCLIMSSRDVMEFNVLIWQVKFETADRSELTEFKLILSGSTSKIGSICRICHMPWNPCIKCFKVVFSSSRAPMLAYGNTMSTANNANSGNIS